MELMVFSPKYNAINAELLADKLAGDEMEQFLARLQRINQREADDLTELQVTNPDAYAKKVKEMETAEDAADVPFFDAVEQSLIQATDPVDKRAEEIEKEVDKDAEAVEKDISTEFDRVEELLNAFYEDVNEKEAKQEKAAENKPAMSLEQVQEELKKITQKPKAPKPLPKKKDVI